MRLRQRMWVVLGVVLGAILAFDLASTWQQAQRDNRAEQIHTAETVRAMLMAMRRVYHQQFLQSGLPVTDDTVGFLPAHAMSLISDQYAEWSSDGYVFRNVSDRPHNPANQADEFELGAMRHFQENPEAAVRTERIADASGHHWFLYTAPIWFEGYCLGCHGEPAAAPLSIRTSYTEGFGRSIGELAGVLSIRLPLERYDAAAAARFQSRLARDLISFSVIFLVLGVLMQRHVIRRLAVLQDGAGRQARGEGTPIAVHGEDEIDQLAASFNQMAREVAARQQALRDSKREVEMQCQLLEERVARRTEELANAVERADGANRAKTAFIANMSHELRTPLNTALGFTDVVLTGQPGPLNDEQRKQLGIVRESGQQLLDIVAEALDLARIESGALQVETRPIDLPRLLAEQCAALRLQANQRGLALLEPEYHASIVVQADPKRLGQVVRNLLSNAIKFTDRGSVRLAVATEAGVARVDVVDSGIGIAPDQQHKLFQSFQRIQDRAGRERPGTGLGLVISRRIVEAMGGTIGFESEPGAGSRFWFTVPLARGD